MSHLRRRFASATTILVIAATALNTVPHAQAAHGDAPKYVSGLRGTPISYYNDNGSVGCRLTIDFWMQEFGDHGVEQFKWRLGAYGTKMRFGQDLLASVISRSGWHASPGFPGDELNYFFSTVYSNRITRGVTSSGVPRTAVMRMKTVGVRPSFWQRDYTAWLDLGVCEGGLRSQPAGA